ncbi:MAG TPA: FAD-dependent oxidoreductase [Acidimicrobiia bacterium]|nr:FAD-dependent oxidoreductase [Acidimicrobiia bacterium]
MSLRTVVVVGASLAGLRAAETLRHEGYDGRIVLVGAEAHEPYDRPPLSKQLLAGEQEPDRLSLRPAGLDDLHLDLELGQRAVSLDLADRAVTLAGGARLSFDGLVIATGASPRLLPAMVDRPVPDGVFVLRTLDDALAIRDRLAANPKVVVVGAGFIGSEVAATCRLRGLDVTVLEALRAPLVRGLGPVLGAVCGELHRDHGVDLRLGVGVAGFDAAGADGGGAVQRVRLDDGSSVDADLVVVGVGVGPVTDWLESSGLKLDNGVVCDASLLAAPGVVAAGDVARWPNERFGGELVRLEHWTNASEQAVAGARRLLHGDAPDAPAYTPVPFVWSDQYDRKIQTVGQFRGDDEMTVVHGSLDERRFVAVFGRAGRLVGALGFSMPAKVMQYRRLLVDGASFDDALEHARAIA